MKHIFVFLISLLVTVTSCSANETDEPKPIVPGDGNSAYFSGKKVLVAYFSWGGTTERMAQQIQSITGADLFEIEPVTPYPTEYTPCTEVALEERDNNARPAIKNSVANWNEYDVVFIGGPVWWHTAPMILHTFAESYDFKGKTVVPFTTYASTYRDETLQAIVDMTRDARHLEGLGLTSGSINESRIQTWIDLINELADEKHATPSQISLAWMLCKKPYIVPIPGTRHLCRLKENIGAADIELTAEEVAAIDHQLDEIPMSEVFGGSKIVEHQNA